MQIQYRWIYTPSQRGNYHHSMFHNPTAAVNLFHVGKQYLTFWKAEAAVTHNLIGRKIISNVKHSDARNSLPILDVIRSSDKRHSASKYCKWRLRQTTGVSYTRIYVLGAPSHFPTEYRHQAAVVSREHRMKWVVVLGASYQWPLSWECKVDIEYSFWVVVKQFECHKTLLDVVRKPKVTVFFFPVFL